MTINFKLQNKAKLFIWRVFVRLGDRECSYIPTLPLKGLANEYLSLKTDEVEGQA